MNIPTWQDETGAWWFNGVDVNCGPYRTKETAEEKYLMYYQFLSAPECHHP